MRFGAHTKNSNKRDKTASGRNARDEELGHAQDTESAAAPDGKPVACTAESQRIPPTAKGGVKRKPPLKPDSSFNSWSRMARNPPTVLLKDQDVRRA